MEAGWKLTSQVDRRLYKNILVFLTDLELKINQFVTGLGSLVSSLSSQINDNYSPLILMK